MHESPQALLSAARDAWQMPLSPEQYNQNPTLTEAEQEALIEVTNRPRIPGRHLFPPNHPSTQTLARLTRPLRDVYDLKQCHPAARLPYLHWMCCQMREMNKPFWIWSKEEWLKAIPALKAMPNGTSLTMRATAYLLCNLLILDDPYFFPWPLACMVFGTAKVREQYERLASLVCGKDGLGYVRSRGQEKYLRVVLGLAMLINRYPSLDTFTAETLQATRQRLVFKRDLQAFQRILQALVSLKIINQTVLTDFFGSARKAARWWEYSGSDIDPIWLAWIQAYSTQTNAGDQGYRKNEFYRLLIVGRWLKSSHPEVVEPGQWDELLGHEYVNWVCQAKMEEFVHAAYQVTTKSHLPLLPRTIESRIGAMRRFFCALARRPYQVSGLPVPRLVLTFDPNEVLVTPENIRRQLLPNPRTLDPAWWQKLTWAAATLSADDLAVYGAEAFPLAYYRAAALVWVTAARRSDEIRRLKVGCVSREWAPEMLDEDGHQIEPEENLSYLRVPTNKMRGEFYVPIPSYTADAIEMWEQLRPKRQDPQVDRKEHKPTDYLFMTRNKLMGKPFLNASLIPLLCKVAGLVDEDGVPLRDAIGRITSHRARSTLASWLRSNGLSLTDIAQLLGHTDLKSLPWYLREDKSRFARAVRKHNPLNRMVTAILDTEALKRGAGEPAVFYYLGYGEDGRPHMCASPDYSTCVHQMHCRKCEMYVDAEQAEVIARRPSVLTIEVHIPTSPNIEEILDQKGLETEITQYLPAPEVPGPAYHLNKDVSPRSNDPELEKLKKDLEVLTAEWTEKEGKFDLRSVGMKSLKKRMADLAAQIAMRETQSPSGNR